MLICSKAAEPTWKLCEPNEPSSSLRPPNAVVSAIRLTSWISWLTSCCSAARSVAPLEPLADWIASSRIRFMALVESSSAPSAVCDTEIPSLALRTAWFRPRICEVNLLAMARPAASSLALLMRRPEDRRCSEVAKEPCDLFRLRCAFSEDRLVLIICAILFSPTPGHRVRECQVIDGASLVGRETHRHKCFHWRVSARFPKPLIFCWSFC